jgi:hypothetical protein
LEKKPIELWPYKKLKNGNRAREGAADSMVREFHSFGRWQKNPSNRPKGIFFPEVNPWANACMGSYCFCSQAEILALHFANIGRKSSAYISNAMSGFKTEWPVISGMGSNRSLATQYLVY